MQQTILKITCIAIALLSSASCISLYILLPFELQNKPNKFITIPILVVSQLVIWSLSFYLFRSFSNLFQFIQEQENLKLLDEEFPDYQNTYYQKYIDARDKAGIKESKEDTQGNFIKYLVEDAPLDF